jgi:hypothetical protein
MEHIALNLMWGKRVPPYISQVIGSTDIHVARIMCPSIDKVLALEKRPEVENLPNAKGREGKDGEPGKILHAAIRHNCKSHKIHKKCARIQRKTDD